MVAKKTAKKTSKRAAKKPAKKRPEPAGTDYRAKYYDLLNKVKTANAAKKADLEAVADGVYGLLQVSCDPDPPGCNNRNFSGTLAQLISAVSEANADKRARVMDIKDAIAKVLQKICDPDPPGCSP